MTYERYEDYERRMQALARVLQFIKKHYLKIVIPLATVTAAVLILLAVTGSFLQDIACEDCTYGELPQCSAKALFSDVTFEFSAEDTDAWTAETPNTVGSYRVRAVSNGGFGQKKYSSEESFVIRPAELLLSVKDMAGVYGDVDIYSREQVEVHGLAEGDRIGDICFSSTDMSRGMMRVSIEDFSVVNGAGEDMTSCYLPKLDHGVYSYQLRRIVFASRDTSKTYDGTALRDVQCYISEGSLAEGDTVEYSIEVNITDVGTVQGRFSAVIREADGTDVSARYSIEYDFGTVTVEPRLIEVSTGSAEKMYDGKTLESRVWTHTEGTLVTGHSFAAQTTGSQTDVGSSDNTVIVRIVDRNGQDVTGNYTVLITAGTLTVKPRPITVYTGSASKIYDGKPLTDGYSNHSNNLVSGHRIEVRVTGSRTVVGKSDNTFEATVYDSKGRIVTHNYDIIAQCGTLEITARILKYGTGSAEKVYDATPLTKHEWSRLDGTPINGHTESVTVTGEQTDAGEGKNTLSVVIYDEMGRDVTAEGYSVEVTEGILRVTPRPFTVTSGSKEKIYDGIPLVDRRCSYRSNQFASDHRLKSVSYTGSQTEVGSSENTFTILIRNAAGVDMTKNYDITYVYGTLTVLPDPENPTAPGEYPIGSRSDTMDDTVFAVVRTEEGGHVYLRETSYGDYTGTSWKTATAYTQDVSVAPPLFFAGESLRGKSSYQQIYIALKSGSPYLVPYYTTDQYCTAYNTDDLSVTFPVRTYYVRADVDSGYDDFSGRSVPSGKAAAERNYRAFVYDNYLQIPESTKQSMLSIASANGIRAGSSTLVADIQSYIQNAAIYNLNVKPFPDGADVAVYFLTTAKEGYCQHFASAATLMYRAFGIPARYTVGFMAETEGDVDTNVTGKMAHAWVEIYLDGVGWVKMEVTAAAPEGSGGGSGGVQYSPDGKILITVSGMTAEKVYDGKPFEDSYYKGVWISSGSLKEGHVLTAEITSSVSIVPGTYYTSISNFRIVDQSGKNVTTQYSVSTTRGVLTIKKRPITVRSVSSAKDYDGTALTADDWWISEGSLVEGDTINISVTGAQTNVGSSANTFVVIAIRKENDGMATAYYEITKEYGILTVNRSEEAP